MGYKESYKLIRTLIVRLTSGLLIKREKQARKLLGLQILKSVRA